MFLQHLYCKAKLFLFKKATTGLFSGWFFLILNPVKPINILIIDDEPMYRLAYGKILSDKGFTVFTKDTAAGILQTVASVRPDVILMDYNMPAIQGDAAIRQLKASPGYHHIPVILFSAAVNIKEIARSCGADAYFLKTRGYVEVLEVVGRVLEAAMRA